jgi:hypothetical protein
LGGLEVAVSIPANLRSKPTTVNSVRLVFHCPAIRQDHSFAVKLLATDYQISLAPLARLPLLFHLISRLSLSVLQRGDAPTAGQGRNRKDASRAKTQEVASQLASLRPSRVFAIPPFSEHDWLNVSDCGWPC